MLLRRHADFTGGIDLPDEKRLTLDEPVRTCEVPERLLLPLSLDAGPAAPPRVQPGQRVSAGEALADPAVDRPGVFAPTDAEVVSISATADVATPSGFVSVRAVELACLDAPPHLTQRDDDSVLSMDPGSIRERIADSGLAMFRPPMGLLASWVRRAANGRCQLLAANVMEDQPYVTADHRVLAENGRDVLLGLALLARAVDAERVAVAVDHHHTDAYRHVVSAAETYGIERIALPRKYPVGSDVILLKVLTGVETPLGAQPLDVGAAFIDVATLLALCRFVRDGHRTCRRVVTVAGQQIVKPANYLVPFGMRCREVAQVASRSLVHGGVMTGLACTPDAVVTPATNAILALGVPEPALAQTCIRCGWCSDHCPMRLNVASLNDAFELVDLGAADRSGAAACIGCGVCSYVCPARLPLTQRVTELRRVLSQLAAERAAGQEVAS